MSIKGAVSLAENAAAGNGDDKMWAGGKTAFVATGTFAGGSIKLQIKIDIGQAAAVYADVPSMSHSAAGILTADLPPGTYRAVMATGSAFYGRLVSIPV